MKDTFIFSKKNYIVMIVGLLLITVGYILMAGGGSEDPNVFNPEIFSARRIRLAPSLVILGLVVQFFGIFMAFGKKNTK